jgi:STE24 endopeptidase
MHQAADQATAATDEARAREYHARQFRLGLASLGLTAAYLGVLVATGAGPKLARGLEDLGAPWWVQVAGIATILGAVHCLLGLPLDWIRGFRLPREFGLLHQPAAAWVVDLVKGLAIGWALGLAGMLCVYALLRTTEWWWLWAGLAFLLGYAALAWVAPVWLVPLFYRLTPLQDEELRRRLMALGERARVPVIGAFVVDESRKSRVANAAVTGLGRTRRILLFDTLIREFGAEEIEAVLAHELGHHAHRDVWRGLLVSGLLTLLAFAIADLLLSAGTGALALAGPGDPGGMPALGLIVVVVGLLTLPLANGWSRHAERQADDFALRVASRPAALIEALERLARINLAERHPHRLKEVMFHSHPAIGRRVARLRAELRQSG